MCVSGSDLLDRPLIGHVRYTFSKSMTFTFTYLRPRCLICSSKLLLWVSGHSRRGDFMKKPAYKWVALAVTTLGSLMVAIDSTIVILACPTCCKTCTPISCGWSGSSPGICSSRPFCCSHLAAWPICLAAYDVQSRLPHFHCRLRAVRLGPE